MNKVIVIAHQKGGVGKSTIAANLAAELSKKYRASIVDLDMQKSLTYFNTLREDEKLQALEILKTKTSAELKAAINDNQNLLIIDAGGYDSDLNRIAIAGADLIITPVSDSGIELVGLLNFREIIRDARNYRPELQAHVLLNKIHPWTNASLNEIFDFIKNNPEFAKLNSILRDRADYKKAFDSGKSVIEFNGKAKEEMQILINEVSQWLK
jgi:chromosome partitioning protein